MFQSSVFADSAGSADYVAVGTLFVVSNCHDVENLMKDGLEECEDYFLSQIVASFPG